MPQPILIIQHITHEGPGLLSALLEKHSVPSVIIDLSRGGQYPDPREYSAVITLGGPQSASDRNSIMLGELANIRIILQENIPYLGICLGMQTLVKAAGGLVIAFPAKETGLFDPDGRPYTVNLTPEGIQDSLFQDLDQTLRVFQLHGETVVINENIALLATGQYCTNQIVKTATRAYGIQSHFELTPRLLESWISIDSDLKNMDSGHLMESFREIRADYEQTGTTLFKNFLRIAESI